MIKDDRSDAQPFLGQCPFCNQGMLRFWFINDYMTILCDECELRWDDVRAIADDRNTPASGRFEEGEESSQVKHHAATYQEILNHHFGDLIAGYST